MWEVHLWKARLEALPSVVEQLLIPFSQGWLAGRSEAGLDVFCVRHGALAGSGFGVVSFADREMGGCAGQ